MKLKKEVTRTDCNRIDLNANAVRVDGNEINWYATFFVTTALSQTEMYCPQDPKKEIVVSQVLSFPSYTNENLDRAVDISLIVPKDFAVEVTELK